MNTVQDSLSTAKMNILMDTSLV